MIRQIDLSEDVWKKTIRSGAISQPSTFQNQRKISGSVHLHWTSISQMTVTNSLNYNDFSLQTFLKHYLQLHRWDKMVSCSSAIGGWAPLSKRVTSQNHSKPHFKVMWYCINPKSCPISSEINFVDVDWSAILMLQSRRRCWTDTSLGRAYLPMTLHLLKSSLIKAYSADWSELRWGSKQLKMA